MRNRVLIFGGAIVLLIGGLFGYRAIEEARVAKEAARLSVQFADDLAEFEGMVSRRPPVPGTPTEGDAVEWYRKALAAFRSVDVGEELLYTVDADDKEVHGVLQAARPMLDLVSAGARAARSSRIRPLVFPWPEDRYWAEINRIGELLAIDASVLLAQGDGPGALDQFLTGYRFGTDLAVGTPHMAYLQIPADAAIEGLVRAVSGERLAKAEVDRLISFLREDLSTAPRPWEFFLIDSLNVQLAVREYFAGRATYQQVRDEYYLPDRHEFLGDLVRFGQTDGELVDGWRRLRELCDEFENDTSADLSERVRSRARESLDAIVAVALAPGAVSEMFYERKRLDLQALLLGARMLSVKLESGAFPADLESIRPPEVTTTPAGGRWSLETFPDTGLPAIYIRGGEPLRVVTPAEEGLPIPPIFRFEK